MASTPDPTNEQIVGLLMRILEELEQIRDSQERLSEDLARVGKAIV